MNYILQHNEQRNRTVIGSRPVAIKHANLVKSILQPKLKIGAPNDKYEREADRVADQVMHMPSINLSSVNQASRSKATIDSDKNNPVSTYNKPFIQRLTSHTDTDIAAAPPIVNDVLHSPGQPLDKTTKNFMESRFKHDFSQIRIHTDTKSNMAAQSVGANAFTLGSSIVFRSGQYNNSSSSKHLLAHELTHTIQQQNNVKRQVLQRSVWSDFLDGAQVVLDVGGLIPGVGIVPDLINAGVSGLRGDKVGVGLSLAAAVPGVGLVAGVGKLGVKGAKLIKATKSVAKTSTKKAAKKTISQKIKECEGIHIAYKSLGNCRSCRGNDTKEQRAAKIICITSVLTGRRRYLRKRCDYTLPGSIARGSSIAEAGHRIQVKQFAKMLAKCVTLPTID